MRDVYLCYDPISSGFIGKLPDIPRIMPVKVRQDASCTRTSIIQSGSATAGIRAGKYTPDGTINLNKI